MAYTPTNWQNGITPINETNLNKIEAGINLANNVVLLDSTFDMNDLTDDGKYFNLAANNPTNKPAYVTNNGAYIEVIKASDTVILQRWTEYQTNTVWERQKASTWGNWILIAKEKNILTAGGTSSVTLTQDGEVMLPINRELSKVGSKLTISNNKIIIGAGVNHVLVSAQLYLNLSSNRAGDSTSALNLSILINGYTALGQTNSGYASARNFTTALSPKLIAASQGDYIEWSFYGANGDKARLDAVGLSFITVEVVD